MIKRLLLQFILVFTSVLLFSQNNWKLERDRQGIKVFTRKNPKYTMKDSRAEVLLKGSADEIIGEFKKVNNHKNWMHRIATSELIKKVSDNEFYVYYVATAPWPVSDRDIIVHYVIKKDANGNYTINASGKPDMLPEKEGKVRIKNLASVWDLTVVSKETTKLVYTNSSEPGGNIPEWLTNSGSTDTPYETLSGLKTIVEK
jgi:hypothetical protein